MTNYWAIAIGINQYQHFQPLMYAERDAQVLRNFLVTEAGFYPARSLLLTDTSPAVMQGSTYPSRDNIQSYIAQLCQRHLQPDDVAWIFFSGYGVQSQGRDYLMPIEGDPANLSTTGISVESLFSTLRAAPTSNIVLVLDINRSQGILAGEGAGKQIMALAEDYGIPTILSCSVDQFSHETLALRQGLFTASLVDGLRSHGCVTLEHLAQFLRKRLPELSEHHWRPRQEPVLLIPDQKRYQLIVPGKLVTAGQGQGTGLLQPTPGPSDFSQNPWTHPDPNMGSQNGQAMESSQVSPPPLPVTPSPGSADAASGSSSGGSPSNGSGPVAAKPAAPEIPTEPSLSSSEEQSWRRLLQVGGVLLLLLLAAVVFRNVGIVTQKPAPPPANSGSPNPTPVPTAPPPPPPLPETGVSPTNQIPPANDVPPASDALPPVDSGSPTEQIAPPASPTVVPTNQGDQPAGQAGSPVGQAGSNSLNAITTAPAASQTAGASNSLVGWLGQVFNPGGNSSSTNQTSSSGGTSVGTSANPGSSNQTVSPDMAILNTARAVLSKFRADAPNNQVSEIAEAIALVRQIQPNQVAYQEAQQDIDRWSQMILDMARGRSARRNSGDSVLAARNYNSAIRAARLVPQDRPEIYSNAQQAIASWNQKIMELANARAAEGAYDLAIQVAQQVPQGAANYAAAQQAIANWQVQLAQIQQAQPMAAPAYPEGVY